MFCGKCGNNLPDDALFCPRCGEKVKSIMNPESKLNGAKSGKTEAALIRRPRVLIGLIAGLAALTVVILMLVLTRGGGLRLFKSAEPYNHETSNFRIVTTPPGGLDRPWESGGVAYYDGYTYYVEDILEINSANEDSESGEWKGTKVMRVSDKGTEPELVAEQYGETLCYLTFFGNQLYALGNDGSDGWTFYESYTGGGDASNTTKNYSVYRVDIRKGVLELKTRIEGVGGSGLVSEGETGYYFQTFYPTGEDFQKSELVIFREEDASTERIELQEWKDSRSPDVSENDKAYFPLGVYRERAYYLKQEGDDKRSCFIISYDLSGKDERVIAKTEGMDGDLYNICNYLWAYAASFGLGGYDYICASMPILFAENELSLSYLKVNLDNGEIDKVPEEMIDPVHEDGDYMNAGTDGEKSWVCYYEAYANGIYLLPTVLKELTSNIEIQIPIMSMFPLGTLVCDVGYGGSWIYVFCQYTELDLPEGYTLEDLKNDEELYSRVTENLRPQIGFWRINKETGEADFIPMYEELLEEEKDDEMASESELD